MSRLTNQTKMWNKRPVNYQPPSHQILLRHWSPVTAVVAIVTVVAHRKVAVCWHGKRAARLGQIIATQAVTTISIRRRHHALETAALRFLSIDIKPWRIDPQRVARQSGEALDIKRLACIDVARYSRNVVRSKYKNVAAMWFDEVIGKLVHEDLVAGVDRAARDDFSAVKGAAGKYRKVVRQGVLWRVNQKTLVLANQP